MSFLDLYDFNGSIKRNKCQEAVFSSMNSRDAFLKSVEEQRKSRALDTKQRQAALRMQRCWRGYRARGRVMDAVRSDFDASVADSQQTLLTQMTRVALFYRWSTEGDNGRLIKVCGDALSLHRVSPLAIRKPLKLFFCRRVLEFISRASGEVLFTMPVRFLETFVEAGDYTPLTEKTKLGYFSPFLTLIAHCAPRQQGSTIHLEEYLPGRLNTLCEQLTAPFGKVGETEKKSLLTSLLCDVFSHRNHLTMTTVVIPFLLRTQNKSYSAMDLVSGVESSFKKLHMHEDICLAEDSFDSLLPSLLMTLLVEKECFDNESDTSPVLHVLALVIPLKMRVGGEESENREEAMEVDHTDQDELSLLSFLRENVERCLKSLAFFNIIKSAVSSPASDLDSILAFEKRLTISTSLHNTITSTGFLTRLFNHLKQMGSSERSVFSSTSRVTPHLERLKGGWSLPEDARLRLLPALSLFCSIVSSFMSSLLDDELLPGGAAAMLLPAIVASTRELRDVCLGLIDLAFPEDFWSTRTQADKKKRESAQWSSVYEKVVVTLRDVYRKNARVGFLPDNFWTDHNRQVVVNRVTWQSNNRGRGRRGHVSSSTTPRPFAFVRYLRDTQHQKGGSLVQSDSEEEGIEDEVPPSSSDMRNLSIVKSIPFVILFQQRLKIFQELLSYDKEVHGVEDDFGMHRRSSVSVSVRRQHLYEDAFDSLTPGKVPNLRLPVRVHMINWVGTDEIGEDGGGIFREFLSELLKTGFDRNRGLFSYTHDGLLYPNPASIALYPGIFSQHFYFLGRMVAKLIYEGQMMDMRFADFFLVQLLGSRMTSIDLEQMKSYDPSVYKHLRGLLSSSAEEIDQLGLDFSVLVDTLGTVETKDLKPGGRNIRVTVENRMEYIQLYVNFFLYKRMEPLVDAMRHGVSDVIDPVWLAMFDPSELQMIVSGVDADVDIEDMRRNCVVYNANDAENERYMTLFWQVAKELSREDKAALLKFITGCSRPPIEGFRHLNPPMGIQLISGADLLPMSATCMNLFKLPKYSNRQMIEEKLRYAINSGAGFEMQ